MIDKIDADVAIIQQNRRLSNQAIVKKDLEGVAKYWMIDMVVISGEGTPYVGKELLVEVWGKMFSASSQPVFERIPVEIQIGESGILAWETGSWHCKNEKFRGNYSAMWRKIKGIWLTQSELFVSLD